MQYSSPSVLTNLPPDRLQSEKCYDLAIIGAGISSAYTLIHYISLLEQSSSSVTLVSAATEKRYQPVKILVTEKSDEFWTGIPYGSRSGRNALLISPLKEFIPQQQEREHFIDWLNQNREWVFEPQKYSQGRLSNKWLQANEISISEGRWDDLIIPRHTFGLYLKQRVTNLLAIATAKGLIEIDLLAVDVQDVRWIENIYRVDVTPSAENAPHFWVKKLVLAIGSPPNIIFKSTRSKALEQGICYIDNMYEPSLDFNIDRLCKSLASSDRQSQRQVLIIGSNAGTLDALYSINNSKLATSLIDKFIVLSPNAAFPHRISRELVQTTYPPQYLLALAQSAPFTAQQIFEAVQQDVANAIVENINISDIYIDISRVVMQALNQITFDEQKQFVFKYAVDIGKLQRRAGCEYLDVIDVLICQNKLKFLKGRFVRFPAATGGSSCEYLAGAESEQKVLDAPIGAIVNCAGFQGVTKSSSVLIQNLIRRKICIPNDSNRGFVIDKNFEASKNCYVMGPLIAGNIDGNFKVWHAESCQRIISLAQQLAQVLRQAEQMESASIVAVPDLDLGVLLTA